MKIMLYIVVCNGLKLILVIFILTLLSSLDAHPISQRNELLKRNPRGCSIQPYDVKCHGTCPIGKDKEFNANYMNCTHDTTYHCNKKKGTTELVEVCAVRILCDKGEEPVILFSGNKNIYAIRCEDCKNETFNNRERLSDSYSQCKRKTQCNSIGQMKCEEPPGREKLWTDSACTCDYASGMSPLFNVETCMPNIRVECSDIVRCNKTEELISNFTCVPKCPSDSYRSKDECIRISKADTDKTMNITLSPTTTLPVTVLPASISTAIISTIRTESTLNSNGRNTGSYENVIKGGVTGGIVLFLVVYFGKGIWIYKRIKWKIDLRPYRRKSVWFWPCNGSWQESSRGDHTSKSVEQPPSPEEPNKEDHLQGDGIPENEHLLQGGVGPPQSPEEPNIQVDAQGDGIPENEHLLQGEVGPPQSPEEPNIQVDAQGDGIPENEHLLQGEGGPPQSPEEPHVQVHVQEKSPLRSFETLVADIPVETLDKSPRDEALINVARAIGKGWECFGIEKLGISDVEIQHIKEENEKQAVMQRFRMLKMWREKNHIDTFRTLLLALHDATLHRELVVDWHRIKKVDGDRMKGSKQTGQDKNDDIHKEDKTAIAPMASTHTDDL